MEYKKRPANAADPAHVTIQRITKYEQAYIIGQRATQLATGATPTITVGNMTSPVQIAEKEFQTGRIPFVVVRHLPKNKKILVKLKPV